MSPKPCLAQPDAAVPARLETSLRGKALLEAIADNTFDLIVVTGLDGAPTHVSPACRHITGYDPEELMGNLSLELVHPADRLRLMGLLRTLDDRGTCASVYRILHKRGNYVWIESTVTLLHDQATEEAIGAVAISRDISVWKGAEEKPDVMDLAPNAMLMVGTDGLITVVNAETERLFGYPRSEMLGRPLEMLIPERFRANHSRYHSAFFDTSATRAMGVRRDLFGLRKDGTEVPVEISLAPIGTADGQAVLASIVDISEHKKAEERLQLFQALVEGAQDYGIFMLDPAGYVLSWNEGAARMTGYSETEIVGQHFSLFYAPDDVAAGRPADVLRIALAEGKFENGGWRVRRDGSRFWASVLITVLLDRHGKLRGFSELTRDNTERKRSGELVLKSERSLRLLADAMPQIVWTAPPDGNVDYFNQQWYEFSGSSKELAGAAGWESALLHRDDLQRSLDCWYAAINSGNPCEIESRMWDRKSGDYRWYLARALPLRDAAGAIEKWIGTATDIDDNKRLSQQLEQRVDERTADLKQMLGERTILLKEVHHRVKNNLQVICSLLSMQIGCSEDELFSRPLKDAHSRVLAMSLIHEKIYQSDTVADIDFGGYIELLSDQLFSAYCVDPTRVRLELSVETIYLTMHQAIPCGLILNELLSNSLKHAFRDGREGVIRVSLRKTETGCAELSVADNGIGLPAGVGWDAGRSFGMQVVQALIKQLRANLSVTADGGAMFTFDWKLPQPANVPATVAEPVPA